MTQLAYDLAWYWKISPEQVKDWALDDLLEGYANASRIQAIVGAGDGG